MHTIYEQRNSVLEMCVFTFRYYNECTAFILNQSINQFFYLTVASNNYNYTAMVSKKHHENT